MSRRVDEVLDGLCGVPHDLGIGDSAFWIVSGSPAGSANWKTAPRGLFADAQRRPPWATTIRAADWRVPFPSRRAWW